MIERLKELLIGTFDNRRQALIQAQLARVKQAPKLSKDVFEVVAKSTIG